MSPPRRLPLTRKAGLAVEVVGTYVRARRAMRGRDLPAALAALRGGGAASGDPVSVEEGLRLGRAVSRTLGLLPTDSRCLIQSVVLTTLLARRGTHGSVVIGVRPGEDFGAHAWVELEGHPLLVPGADEFPRLVEL